MTNRLSQYSNVTSVIVVRTGRTCRPVYAILVTVALVVNIQSEAAQHSTRGHVIYFSPTSATSAASVTASGLLLRSSRKADGYITPSQTGQSN